MSTIEVRKIMKSCWTLKDYASQLNANPALKAAVVDMIKDKFIKV